MLLRSFRLSLYATLAAACLCLGYAEADLLPEVPYVTALAIVLIVVAHRLEGRWSLSVQSANSVGVVLAMVLVAWIGFQFVRDPISLLDALPFPANLLPYFGPVLIILVPAKLFRPKRVADCWAIHGIGLLAVTLGCALAYDFAFIALLVAYLFCFAWSLTLFYFYREGEMEERQLPENDKASPWPLVRSAGRWSLWIGALCLLAFILTPLPPERKWELTTFARGRLESGLSDGAVDLNRTGSLELNGEIAFQVYAEEAAGNPKLDLDPGQHWRAAALSRYENGRWLRERIAGLSLAQRTEPAPRSREELAIDAEDRRLQRNRRLPQFGPDEYYLTFILHRHAGNANIAADPIVWRAYDVPPIMPFLRRAGSVLQHQDGQFEWLGVPGAMRESYCQATVPLAEPDLGPPLTVAGGYQEFLTWISTSETAERLRRWTTQVLGRLVREGKLASAVLRETDPQTGLPAPGHHEAIARALRDYLADSGEFSYTLELNRKDRSIDPVEDFLYNTRAGHCQRFATALVMALRSLGIPTQLVIGFRGCENLHDGRYLVRQSHAHAWVEALVPRSPPANAALLPPGETPSETMHWLSLDPTPSGEPSAAGGHGLANWLQGARAWAEMIFRNVILGEDAAARDRILESITGAFGNFSDALTSPEVNWTKAAFTGAMFMGSAWCIRRVRRRRMAARPAKQIDTTGMRLLSWQRRLVALLAPLGLSPRTGQTLREFASQAAGFLEIHADAVADVPGQVAEACYRVRFGGQLLRPEEQESLDASLARLDKSLREARMATAS